MTKRQLTAFTTTSIINVSFAVILNIWDASVFETYLGDIDPVLGLLLASSLGYLSVRHLVNEKIGEIYGSDYLKSLKTSTLFAVCFGAVIIMSDFTGIFPGDINVPYPKCLIFYPVMGYIVEVIFHLLPITLLYLVGKGENRSFYLVALLEPVYQSGIGGVSTVNNWAFVFVFVHILLINLAQLRVFKKFGFISMYGIRLVYYLIWHEIWGIIRLDLLF